VLRTESSFFSCKTRSNWTDDDDDDDVGTVDGTVGGIFDDDEGMSFFACKMRSNWTDDDADADDDSTVDGTVGAGEEIGGTSSLVALALDKGALLLLLLLLTAALGLLRFKTELGINDIIHLSYGFAVLWWGGKKLCFLPSPLSLWRSLALLFLPVHL